VVILQQALQLPYTWSEQIILENAEQPEGKKKREVLQSLRGENEKEYQCFSWLKLQIN
jgi:hypothetical protein